MPSIDARLDRLVERHEALTQTVVLMALENKERDRRMEERDKRLDEIITQMAAGIASLLHIAEIHEQRLSDLEGH
jgi:hypothetical protein